MTVSQFRQTSFLVCKSCMMPEQRNLSVLLSTIELNILQNIDGDFMKTGQAGLGLINFREKNKFLYSSVVTELSLLTFLQSNRTIKTPTKKAGVGNIHGVKTLYNCPHGGRCQLHNNFLPFFLFPLDFCFFWISISGQTESGRAETVWGKKAH